MIDTVTALNARDDWLWIVHHWGDLQARLRPAGGDPNAPKVSRTVEHPPLPIDPHVSDVILKITELSKWYGIALIKEGGWIPKDGDLDMPRRLAKVAEHYGHFTADDREALDFCDSAFEMRQEVERILEKPERARYVGDCPTEGCRGDLYLPGGAEGGRCRECGTAWTMDGQRAWLRDQMDTLLLTYSETFVALKVLGLTISDRTWERWTSSGTVDKPKVPKVAKNDDDLYPLIDAVRMAAALPKYRSSDEVLATVGVV